MENFKITDVRVLPGDSAFLLDDGKTAILYDTGFAFTGYAVADKVKAVLGERELDYIFLTHSHYDHAAGSAYVKRRFPSAKVVAGEYAAKIFQKPTAKAVMRDLDMKFAVKCGVTEYEDLFDELSVDMAVSDGDTVKAGDLEFTVLNLPGHTKCSVGYWCPAKKLLLGCETLGVYNGEDDVVPSYLVGYQMTCDAIKRAEKLGVRHILVPHYGLLSDEKADFFLKKAWESATVTASEILAMLKENISTQYIMDFFKKKFYRGYVKETYPIDAMELNTSITIKLLQKEFDINIGE
ncbi:MAG: MBL fold metallo-hydrolase [Ruminococcaceae bacterium]|nr:MBL fold metallo-hydrolase [Oscillospiraceae bacterium]